MIMMVNAIGVLGRDTKMDRRECGASIGKIKENEREKERKTEMTETGQAVHLCGNGTEHLMTVTIETDYPSWKYKLFS